VIEVRRTAVFQEWADGLRDVGAKTRIAARLDRIELGNFGDARSVGEGVSELASTMGLATDSISHGEAK
jgi:putative addiction module killer protein